MLIFSILKYCLNTVFVSKEVNHMDAITMVVLYAVHYYMTFQRFIQDIMDVPSPI